MAATARSLWFRYGIAFAAALLSLAFSHYVLLSNTPFLPCIAALLLISWQLGRGPGYFAALFFIIGSSLQLFVVSPSASPIELRQSIVREVTFVGVAALIIAISAAQRRAEADLRNAADRFRLALEVGNLIPWELNIASDELISEGLHKILSVPSITTRTQYFAYIHPDDVDAIKSVVNTALLEHKTCASQYRLVKPDGEIRWVELRAQPIYNERFEAIRLVGVLRDLTEQKYIEKIVRDGQEQYRNVAESAYDGFVTVDENNRILYANGSFAALFGYERAELIGMSLTSVIPDRHRDRHRKGFDQYMQTGVKTVDWSKVEFPGLRKDGSEVALEMSYSEMGVGTKRLLTAIVRDVSQRKKDAEAMVAASQRLELAQRIAGIGLFDWDFRTGHSTISLELEAMYGLKPGEFKGTYEAWEKLVHPDDVPMVRNNARIMLQEIMPEYSSVYRVVWPDKSVHWLASKTQIFRDESKLPIRALGVNLDITREKEAEAERERLLQNEKQARERLSLTNRIAGIGTYEMNMQTGVLDMSPESRRLYGLMDGEVVRTHDEWKKYVHPNDLERELLFLHDVTLTRSGEFQTEYRIVWADGSIHWLMTKGSVLYDEYSRPIKIVGAEQDITRRKEAQAERESMLAGALAARVRMELANRIAGIGTFEWDAISGETKFSPELEALYGLQLGEFRQTYEHWTKLVYPEDWPRVRENAERFLKSTGTDYTAEFRIVWPDSSIHWITTKGRLYRDDNGKPLKLIGVEQDITRKKSEEVEREALLASEKRTRERFELAQRTARIGIHERSFKTGLIQCSPQWLTLLGMSADTFDFTFDGWMARVHPDDRDIILHGIDESGRLGAEYSVEFRVTWPDGSVHWLSTSGKVQRDANGQPNASIGATIDITERKALDAQRERILAHEKAARTEAERTNQLKDEFLATVSHELRTPLTAIIGWSQLLTEAPPEPEMLKRGLDSILRNSRAQAELIEDLLDVSRIATGQMRIQIKPLDLSEIVAAAVDGIRPGAKAKKIALELDLHPSRISGDPDRLQQVAFNILFNAVKFSNLGGRIHVSVQALAQQVRFAVIDNGKGISPEFLPKLFQQFTQEDGSATRGHGGMGLGLAITKHLVELHGGNIRAESDGVGKGTTLIIELPELRRGETMLFTKQ